MQFLTDRHAEGLVFRVRWLQPHAIRSVAQPFDRVLATDGHHSDRAIDRLRRAIHHQQVAIQNACVSHAVTVHAHHERCGLVLDQIFREIERGLEVIFCRARKASRHLPLEKWQHQRPACAHSKTSKLMRSALFRGIPARAKKKQRQDAAGARRSTCSRHLRVRRAGKARLTYLRCCG